MSRDIDALTSYTLKHLRDRWWTARWTHWVSSHLRCDPGERLIHIGCGNGEIDVALALATPGLDVVSIDAYAARARHTRNLGADVGVRLSGDAGSGVRPYASAAYRHAWGDRASLATVGFVGTPGTVAIAGAPIAEDAADARGAVSPRTIFREQLETAKLRRFRRRVA